MGSLVIKLLKMLSAIGFQVSAFLASSEPVSAAAELCSLIAPSPTSHRHQRSFSNPQTCLG
jgi:hypothetical protein